MRRVWTIEEIHSCPDFGSEVGWFYGLTRHEGKLRIIEILPGLGYTIEWPSSLRMAWLMAKDIYYAKLYKEMYVGQGDPSKSRYRTDASEYITLDELLAEFDDGTLKTTPWSEIKHKNN
jgi:hypothetical protein